ncbi:YheU family protein [Shewanella sp. KX20019]|uniref:YheU family protein n=1 Tax=Shewanella sp. KX20019 TaxID=2803864 RepID=UPI0019255B86|nr:YheU family protein [Shewanella sp. KX20019]QQX79532.1 YheU family protein [Shewanella sp. KX20019]
MLVPYEALTQLPAETFDNIIKEFLIGQLEDGSFSSTDNNSLKSAISTCRAALARGELVVEFSEEDESIAIRRKEDIVTMDPAQD